MATDEASSLPAEKLRKSGPATTALKWAQWPAAFGLLVGISAAMKGSAPVLGKMMLGAIAGAALALIFGGITFGIVYVAARARRAMTEERIESATISSNEPHALETGNRSTKNSTVEDHFYETAWSEIEDGTAKKSLWSRLFAECNGDINRVQARYIELRVVELRTQEQERLKREELQKEFALANRTEEQLMTDYGITFDGVHYHFETYRYTNLKEAINYAKLQRGKK